jgi:Peptidase family M23/Fibronectin type III domain/Carbohydrate binding domain
VLVVGGLALSARSASAALLSFPVNGWTHPLSTEQFEDWGFGSCNPPYTYNDAGVGNAHLGTDSQGAPAGSVVHAIGDGEVVRISASGWPGAAVGVLHSGVNGQFVAVYAHLANVGVAVGDRLAKGQQIGTVLNQAGNSHLHFGVWPVPPSGVGSLQLWGAYTCLNGVDTRGYVNPIPFLSGNPPGNGNPPPPTDTDGDGIPDSSDKCPTLHGHAAWQGCRTNFLRNGSLEEENNNGWGVLGAGTQIAAYGDAAVAREGVWYGAMNVAAAAGSIYQDVQVAAQANDSFTFSMWVRKESPGLVNGRLVMFGVGGAQNIGVGDSFSVGTDWTLVSATYDVRASHSFLRAQMYIDTPGENVLFDGAEVTKNLLRNGSLEEENNNGWGVSGAGTQIAAYGDAAAAREGGWYGAMNVASAGGSVFQDVQVASQATESYTFSMWVRKESPGTVNGRLVLWGVGGAQNLNGAESFAVGTDWTLVSATYDVRSSHSFLRAQMYIDTPSENVLFDGAQVARNGFRNASMEEGSTSGWGVLGAGTNIAAYKDTAVARDGEWFGAMNVAMAGGSIYQDIGIAPLVGESYTFSMWVRKATPGTVNGSLVMFGVGGTQNLGVGEGFSIGTDWTLVSTTYDARLAHVFLRAQMYIDTPGQDVFFDGAMMNPGARRITPPSAPRTPTATALNAAATVNWSASIVSGGSSVDGYVITAMPGGTSQFVRGSSASSTTFSGLTNGTAYRFSVRAKNASGLGPEALTGQVVPALPPTPPADGFIGLVPVRLLDTRTGGSTVDGLQQGIGLRARDTVFELPVAGRGGVPGGVSGVVMNVTVVSPSGDGFLTVFPCGEPKPVASSLNFRSGGVVANAVVSRLFRCVGGFGLACRCDRVFCGCIFFCFVSGS